MSDNYETHALIGRHTLRKGGPESKRYPGITRLGVELGRKIAKSEVLDFIEQSPENAIVFLAGVSDEVRTRSTAEVYSDTLQPGLLKKLFDKILNKEKFLFIGRDKIKTQKKKGDLRAIQRIVRIASKNPDKRVVIAFPLFLKELSSKRSGTVLEDSEYFKELKKRTDGDQHKLVRMWIETNGHINGVEDGPKPQDIADNYKKAVTRLEQFIRKQLPNRPVSVVIIGHSWELDVAIAAFVNNGKVDLQSFDQVTLGGIIKETESARIVFGSQETVVTYRGKEFKSQPKSW